MNRLLTAASVILTLACLAAEPARLPATAHASRPATTPASQASTTSATTKGAKTDQQIFADAALEKGMVLSCEHAEKIRYEGDDNYTLTVQHWTGPVKRGELLTVVTVVFHDGKQFDKPLSQTPILADAAPKFRTDHQARQRGLKEQGYTFEYMTYEHRADSAGHFPPHAVLAEHWTAIETVDGVRVRRKLIQYYSLRVGSDADNIIVYNCMDENTESTSPAN